MQAIRSAGTRPEMLLRRALHRAGLRYRLQDRSLPGTPDLVLRSRRAAILVHGCFWHGHDCPKGVLPGTRRDFWDTKLRENRERDARNATALADAGWRVVTVWECALVGKVRLDPAEVVAMVRRWLADDGPELTVAGLWPAPQPTAGAAGASSKITSS
jgi:DNA mismatch endonuclease (patch repair protein)